MKLADCNPYLRVIEIQPTVLSGYTFRYAFDNRIFYILSGEGQIIFENKTINIGKDCVIFIKQQVGYYFSGQMKVAVINFDFTNKKSHLTTPICPTLKKCMDKSRLFDETTADEFGDYLVYFDPYLKAPILDLVGYFNEEKEVSALLCPIKLKEILAQIYIRKDKKFSTETLLYEKVYTYIKINATENITNESIAKSLGYHPVYLAEIVKKVTGKTLHEIILTEKINASLKLLTDTSLSVEDIALSCGFSSRSHFCTVFKNKVGKSPLTYKKESMV